ncbi:hypothetical protein PR002_g24447 [Phytophthora rubi]|uniref:Uncharacterized protein n=1 Tax=Phytophthora rubi TaxID=129364 RepID=A0A6A3IFP4_9STRA|nr:hypothetical protein PR002_g24447 [Phytophthora rubi]
MSVQLWIYCTCITSRNKSRVKRSPLKSQLRPSHRHQSTAQPSTPNVRGEGEAHKKLGLVLLAAGDERRSSPDREKRSVAAALCHAVSTSVAPWEVAAGS